MIQYLIITFLVEESWKNIYIALKVHLAHMKAG